MFWKTLKGFTNLEKVLKFFHFENVPALHITVKRGFFPVFSKHLTVIWIKKQDIKSPQLENLTVVHNFCSLQLYYPWQIRRFVLDFEIMEDFEVKGLIALYITLGNHDLQKICNRMYHLTQFSLTNSFPVSATLFCLLLWAARKQFHSSLC